MRNLILLAIIALTAFSCGSEPDNNTTTTTPAASEQEAPAANQAEAKSASEVKLDIAGNDQMQFDKKELKVYAGQKVTLTLTHSGEMAKEVMGHNFILLKPGTDLAAFAADAVKAKDNDYIPESDAIIVYTKMLGGGESDTITFDAPEKGTYDFICSFPGHYALMQGKFIVE
jgi:azurin